MRSSATNALHSGISRAISREAMAGLPIRRYEGDVRLAATAADLEHALTDFRQETVVGFDTETRPAFRKGEFYLPCLVQAATARAVWGWGRQPGEPARTASGGLASSGGPKPTAERAMNIGWQSAQRRP